jgi:protein-S-isoprenylcysteine O-methyltransferase Ste14
VSALSSPVLVASMSCWFAFELALAARDVVRRKGRSRHDRGTRTVVSFTLGVSVLLGAAMTAWVPGLDLPAPGVFAVAGAAVFWLGLAVRAWAVVALGGSFRTSVEVDAGQAVVTSGPYRWVRHPSYTGLLLIVLGIGIALANPLSLVVCVVLPVAGLLPRIAVEEAEMVRVLGEPYDRYRAVTRRLVPGIW